MNVNTFLFKDSTGKKSVTMTAFVWGCLVVNLKLIVSGMVIGGTTFSQFTGVDYSTAVTSLGAVYVLRRHPALDGSKVSKEEKPE